MLLKRLLKPVFVLVVLSLSSTLLQAWGYWGHQHINRAAVFALPEEMRRFFYNHIDFMTEESVIPDVRKYAISDKAEPYRHYMDLESFETIPQDSFPKTLKDATAKYDPVFLDKNGVLPWYIIDMTEKLTNAFKGRKKAEILFLSADLGHYVSDAHMPLHTALNHDGQLTDQRGIHSFWEAQIPELFGDSYNFYTGDAVFIPDVSKEVWRIINNSNALADTLLLVEKKAKEAFGADKVYVKDEKGAVIKNKYGQWVRSKEWAAAYHSALNGMVEKQLRLSIAGTANFIYTAWVNAGKPDLDGLDPEELTKRNAKNYKKDFKLWKTGKLFGFKIDKEY